MIRPSQRARALPVYATNKIAERKRALRASGVDVIDLGAGDADLAPPSVAVEALYEAAQKTAMSRYAFQQGLPDFREAVVRYMARRFGLEIDPGAELLPLLGSKDGLAHLPFAVLDPTEVCIIPEPGYPAYRGGGILAGADLEIVPLRPENDFLVELEELPAARLERAKLVFLNYPNNPTGAVAPRDYLERTVEICRKHGILLAYDNPYVELTFDRYRAPSILEIPGAREIALEFHSFSKSFGMTGWRLGWAVGNPEAIKALSKVKSYVDTGAFLAIQQAGARVLDEAARFVEPVRTMFESRRTVLVTALRDAGWPCEPPRAAMYLWVRLPDGVSSVPFAEDLLENHGLAVLAGASMGQGGEGFVRLSFIAEEDRMREAAARMGAALETTRMTGPRA